MMIITIKGDVISINLSSEPVMMIMVLVSPGSFPPRAFDDDLMIMMIMIMMLTIGHLSFLLRSDQGVLLLVLVKNRDLVIQDFVVHPNNRGDQPEYLI